MTIQSYKNLEVWKKSIDLVDLIYIITRELPKSEIYALASQMQRAAVGIPSNIAEGFSRNYTKEYIRFLSISYSSAAELETQIIICKRQYPNLPYGNIEQSLEELKKMLYVLISRLKPLTVS
jgi:four helix bundle protein